MDDRRLKEYAFKIYSGDKDYSLNKAYRLFPKYFPKIAFFYTEILVQKQEELTRSMIKSLGVIKAVELRDTAVELNKEIKKYRNKIIQELKRDDIYEQIFDNEYDMYLYGEVLRVKNIKTLKDLRKKVILNREALKSVEKIAQKYRYNDIFTEASAYIIKNEEIFWQIAYAIDDYRERTERFYQYYETI